ncbi:putative alpha-L-arabinofuranosidase A [Lachnellula suecica]|uniref:non-reducing end alpha-L-arabinofuranosidase n=1 Tax=Lachnellula suecica TaxID=602035 RepID=A0A8T9CHZ5_9HELO|nr:putative alpha-L-arabinofuranosidase A [Lachnellula suecica]
MKLTVRQFFTLLAFIGCSVITAALELTVSGNGGNATSPILYGLLFEDVYHSGDGGIYGEMIQNRAMQGADLVNNEANRNLVKWHNWPGCILESDNSAPLLSSALPYQMSVAILPGAKGTTGMWNEGYSGFNITTATRYAATFWLRGYFRGTITAEFWSNTTGSPLGSTTFEVSQTASQGWIHYAQTFTVFNSAPDFKNTFHLTFDSAVVSETIYFNMISVFQQTFKDGKLRMDLANAVNDLGGKFLRFPGGNNLEGISPPNRWVWSNTIGPIENRPGRPGTWGYYNTDGLGLLEQMDWCQSMNLEPILALWAGYYINGVVIPQGSLQEYINEAMDELEFLMGSTFTKNGALRASLGYPNPFAIKYVEIGNEDFFDGSGSYTNYRFMMFYNAIHAKYPSISIISSLCIGSDPGRTCSSGSGWTTTKPPPGVISDLHLYKSSDAMVGLFHEFDNAPRNYPILIGEYAAIYADNDGGAIELDNPTVQSATAEAVMFLGLERNSDVVMGVAHGALMKSQNDEPDNVAMIKHNANSMILSWSYHIYQMFAHNFGSRTAPTSSDSSYGPLYWSSTIGPTGTYYIKVVNYKGAVTTPVAVTIAGSTARSARLISMTGSAQNALDSKASPITEASIAGADGVFSFTLQGVYSVAILVVG